MSDLLSEAQLFPDMLSIIYALNDSISVLGLHLISFIPRYGGLSYELQGNNFTLILQKD